MEHGGGFLGPIILAVALGGPLLLGLAGLVLGRRSEAARGGAPDWDWRLFGHSALLYTFAFNLIFFIQELFLVLPKALTPGLHPILYHNNHRWTGSHPLESLFQGMGALAIFLTGLACAWLVARGTGRSRTLRLFLIWMAYHGLFQSLPQVAIGALAPGNDVGMAMDYFALGAAAKFAAAMVALAGMVAAGLWLTRPLLSLAGNAAALDGTGRRTRFAFNVAVLPGFAAIPLIILYRIPRETLEVVAPPVAVAIVGLSWIAANAWRAADAVPARLTGRTGLREPLILCFILLLVFHLVLRPGIAF